MESLESFYKTQRKPTLQIIFRAWLPSSHKHFYRMLSSLHLHFIVWLASLFSTLPFFARKRH